MPETQRQARKTAPEDTVTRVLADGFGVNQASIENAIQADEEFRRAFNRLVGGTGTSETVDELHALVKQRLLFER